MAPPRSSELQHTTPRYARQGTRPSKGDPATHAHAPPLDDEVINTERTHFTVHGRRWKATDPNLPEPHRAALTRELMIARRAVKEHKGVDVAAERAARARVQDAKSRSRTGCAGKNARQTGTRQSFFPGSCHPLFDRSPVTLVAGLRLRPAPRWRWVNAVQSGGCR